MLYDKTWEKTDTFLPAATLGLGEEWRDALIKVLRMLENNELAYVKPVIGLGYEVKVNGFNMGPYNSITRNEAGECGTAACIAGWASMVVGKSFPLPNVMENLSPTDEQLWRLFFAPTVGCRLSIQPEQAAVALRGFLTTGKADWSHVS